MDITATALAYPATRGPDDEDTITCRGIYYAPARAASPLPVVLVCHAWDGLGDEVRGKAASLAAEGYIAFAIDVYGEGHTETDLARLEQTMGPYLTDRALLLARLRAAVTAAQSIPGADPSRIGAMGYCFGGLAVLDLARSADPSIRAVAAFHGLLNDSGLAASGDIDAGVLVLHGEGDTLVPPTQVAQFKAEMDARSADWTLISYARATHGFALSQAAGNLFNKRARRRSWRAMCDFFAETLGPDVAT